MFRFAVALLIGLVGAAIVHIGVVFAMPWVASSNSWGRLTRLGPLFDVVRIDPQRAPVSAGASDAAGEPPVRREFAFVDPAFVTASCRFALADGPVRLRSDRTAELWSASIYTRRGDNLYSINDRSAVGGRFDLLIGSPQQLLDTRATSPDPNETTIPVEFGETEGYVTLRTAVDEESMRPDAEAFLRGLECATDEEFAAAPVDTPETDR